MNLAESLSREVERVTTIRDAYRAAGPDSSTCHAMDQVYSHLLDTAHKAAGAGDVVEILHVHSLLKGVTE